MPTTFARPRVGCIASTNANILSEGGAILPLGGDEEHGGHKGYCLSSIVDILSAVLPGANFGPFIVPTLAYRDSSKSQEVGKGIGHFFGAMRVDAFRPADEFKQSMDIWIKAFKNATPIEGVEQVLIPGEPERILEAKHKKEGITLMDTVITRMTAIGEKYNIPF